MIAHNRNSQDYIKKPPLNGSGFTVLYSGFPYHDLTKRRYVSPSLSKLLSGDCGVRKV